MMKERKSSSLVSGCDQTLLMDAREFEEIAIRELRSAGYRITMPRVQVIRALADSEKALSAYAVHEKIISSGGKIDVVSVYRILATLQEVGLIHHIGVVDGYFPSRVGPSYPRDRAQHFVCASCGCVTEVRMPEEIFESISTQAQELKFSVDIAKLEVLGKCARCAKKAK